MKQTVKEQKFYLVCASKDDETVPLRIFTDRKKAIAFGINRGKIWPGYSIELWVQEEEKEMRFLRYIEPFKFKIEKDEKKGNFHALVIKDSQYFWCVLEANEFTAFPSDDKGHIIDWFNGESCYPDTITKASFIKCVINFLEH